MCWGNLEIEDWLPLSVNCCLDVMVANIYFIEGRRCEYSWIIMFLDNYDKFSNNLKFHTNKFPDKSLSESLSCRNS